MRVVFMGTPDFAVPSLSALLASHDVAAVVTQPDKPKGRGNKVQLPPVKALAQAHGVPVLQPVKMKDGNLAAQLAAYDADAFIVAAYGRILPKSILNLPRYGCLNVHGSLLPLYRGAAPIHHAILNGETETGVTIMLMDEGLDTGDMLLKKTMPILPEDNAGTVHDKMAALGAEALIETLTDIEKALAERVKQDDTLASYAGLLTKEMGRINWHGKSAAVVNMVRGLNPWPCAYTYENGRPLKIWAAQPFDTVMAGQPGEIVNITHNALIVQCGDGCVMLTEIQAQGGKRMHVADYLRGHQMPCGFIFDDRPNAVG